MSSENLVLAAGVFATAEPVCEKSAILYIRATLKNSYKSMLSICCACLDGMYGVFSRLRKPR